MYGFLLLIASYLLLGVGWGREPLSTLLPRSEIRGPCESSVNALLTNHLERPIWQEQISWREGEKRYTTTGRQFGAWVDLEISTGRTRVGIVTQTKSQNFEFTPPACGRTLLSEVHREESTSKEYFTDRSLKNVLAQSRAKQWSGIVYIWSPREEFSLKGLRETQNIARGVKLQFVPVVDPSVDTVEAAQALVREKITRVEPLKLESHELSRRGARNNFPTLLMFKNGELVGPVVPGYLTPVELNMMTRKYL